MKNEDIDLWSGLKTVSSFDIGDNSSGSSTVALGVDVKGEEANNFSPSSILVESLIDQLCKMMEKDPADQKTLYLMICDKLHQMKLIDSSYHMEKFEFMRSRYQRALFNLLSVAKTNYHLTKISGSQGDGSSMLISSSAVLPKSSSLKINLSLPSDNILEWSRYANEFVELEFIARGGFGQVYKARHKLDDTVYAIKKIHLRYQNANSFLRSLREVKMLACLNHPNIVAYKAAWLEPFDNRREKQENFTIGTIDNNDSFGDSESDESSNIIFEKSKSTDNSKKLGKSNSCDESSNDSKSVTSKMAVCKLEGTNFNCRSIQADFKDWATLFVQMQLCEINLREWLDRRNRFLCNNINDINIEQSLSIFIKVLRGIEYIHDKGIVHHDIKPSNIFVSENLLQVQVGDFGLACCLLTHSTLPFVQRQPFQHKGQIGTKLYAAPEQMAGVCSPKSDLYSCGILLLELIKPFQTDMERSKVISLLKRGQIPTELTALWPNLVKIISLAVSSSMNKRPSATDLLNFICNNKDFGSSSLDHILHEKDRLILNLKEEIAAKDEELLILKQKLADCNGRCKQVTESQEFV